MNRTHLTRLPLLVGLLVLAACAQSPQKIALAPQFAAVEQQVGQQRPLHVRVSDARSDKVLGSRGGVYRDTAVFTLADGLSSAVQPALQKHLAAMGFDVDSLSADTVDLHVLFDSLVYNHPKEGGVGHDMDMAAEVRVEARRENGDSYQGRYRVNRQQKFFNAPAAPQNEELVNELVVEVLTNMLADPKLMSFLLQQ